MRNGGFRRRKEERWGDGDARFAAFNGGSKVRSSPRPPWPNDSTFSFSFFFFGRGGDEGGRRGGICGRMRSHCCVGSSMGPAFTESGVRLDGMVLSGGGLGRFPGPGLSGSGRH